MDKILAFVDLLGFSKMVESDYGRARIVLNDFYNICFSIIKRDQRVNGSLFSDSLLAHSSDYASLVNCITEIYRQCLARNEHYQNTDKFFLLPRGAISIGYVNIEERVTSPNLTKDFIVSPALVHSAKLEQSVKGSRLLVAVKSGNDDQEKSLVWNREIKTILYENSSFEFWKNYTYSDSLWFLDLKKSTEQQQQEVLDLIRVSIKLVENNSKNEKALEQHVNTLRIGLLSYTKFLESSSDAILAEVIKKFSADKYWIVWLTVFELITNCKDPFLFSSSPKVVAFYKKCSLKPGWVKVLEEINKPGQKYLLQSFQRFLDELAIRTTKGVR
jgi:hypothetical protein